MTTEARADELSNMPKTMSETWRWRYMDRKNAYEEEVEVACVEENITLRFIVRIDKRLNYSYSLLHKGSIPIRRWGSHTGHRNPDNDIVDGAHKHKWRDNVGDSFAYPTDDVCTSDADEAFFDFCDEENIELNGRYYRFEGSRIDDWM